MSTFFDRRVRIRPLRLDGFPPALAGDIAYRRFCHPRFSTRRTADHAVLVERARFHLRNARWVEVATTEGPVQAYVFEPDKGTPERGGVLVAHGWTSEASFMAVIAEQLRRAGFRVVTFDQPGHGKSSRERASLIDCSRALLQVAEALGPVRFALTHSMGGLAALLAGEGRAPLGRACPFERYVLISSPNRFGEIAREFGEELSLGPAAQRVYERHLERIAHRPMGSFTAANMLAATGRPALVVHSRDDSEVSFQNAEEIAAACPLAELKAVAGFGHRNILFAPPVIRAALSYLTDI
jgi:pimeloyl-ACP methyl ester carboxylesterase